MVSNDSNASINYTSDDGSTLCECDLHNPALREWRCDATRRFAKQHPHPIVWIFKAHAGDNTPTRWHA
jgi:hypothetical protein